METTSEACAVENDARGWVVVVPAEEVAALEDEAGEAEVMTDG